MHLGILQFEMLIHDAASLKDKRRVVRSIKDRLHREHMVAVAEVGMLDRRDVARLGLAAVSNDGQHLSVTLDRIIAKLRAWPDAELGDFSKQIVGAAEVSGGESVDDAEALWTPEERRGEEA